MYQSTKDEHFGSNKYKASNKGSQAGFYIAVYLPLPLPKDSQLRRIHQVPNFFSLKSFQHTTTLNIAIPNDTINSLTPIYKYLHPHFACRENHPHNLRSAMILNTSLWTMPSVMVHLQTPDKCLYHVVTHLTSTIPLISSYLFSLLIITYKQCN